MHGITFWLVSGFRCEVSSPDFALKREESHFGKNNYTHRGNFQLIKGFRRE